MNTQQINQLKQDYQHADFRYDIQYTLFQVKDDGVTITAYQSGKVVFAGKNASMHAAKYGVKTDPIKPTLATFPMSGSDEVGTGDYFGPVTVCACYVTKENLKEIPVDLITDSKAMTDDLIIEIAPLLMQKLEHSLLILDNYKYNEIQKTNNLNEIKAKLHNQAFINLNNKVDLSASTNIIDQFVNEKNYFEYIKNEPAIFKALRFETKAEHQFIAVACGAIIARYAFLYSFMDLEKKYNFQFPKGSGKQVNVAAKKFIDLYGKDELVHVAKIHFKITDTLL